MERVVEKGNQGNEEEVEGVRETEEKGGKKTQVGIEEEGEGVKERFQERIICL